MIKITAITSAIWINHPRLEKMIEPNSHSTRRIMPMINKIFILTSLISR
jgi:hypothetical protein